MTIGSRPDALTAERINGHSIDPASARAQQRAWLYLWAAFIVWCVLVGSGLYVGYTWRKTSYYTPPAQLVSKRGIVLYQGPRDSVPLSISERAVIEEGGVLEVPPSSEAIVQLGVENSSVRLRSGSRMRFATMRVGRFNRELTQVRLEQLDGGANYTVAGELPDGRELEIKTPHAQAPRDGIKLTKGEYLVWVQPGGTRLISYVGQAKAEAFDIVYRLRDGKWVLLGAERPEMKHSLALPEHLLRNRDFSRGLVESWIPIDIGEKGRPDVGGQRSLVDETINGKPVRGLRLTRETTKDTHNETGIRQDVEQEVWAYRSVTLSALVKVHSASLDGGGYAGSEYPVMLRVHYVGENGGNYTWAQGFYTTNESNRPADLGEQIPANHWHPFSIDLARLRERPAFIASVEVLASGHDFDAEVTNLALVAE